MRLQCALGLVLQSAAGVGALQNNLSLTPSMGFNNWDEMPLHYAPWVHGFNESEVYRVAGALVQTGMAKLGFTYVNLDCGWSTGYRSADGKLQVNATLFPSAASGDGFAPLAAKVHSMGLKLGIYTSGHQCCSPKDGTDGSEGMEEQDAQQFADWGIDYVKDDDCGSSPDHFTKMRNAIAKTKRPMVYSIHSPWTHKQTLHPNPRDSVSIANSARTTNDITPSWETILDRAHTNNLFANLSQPGYFNDPDMLEIGNGKLTDAEGRSQLALWCLMRAPLLSGTDISRATEGTIRTLTASEVIAVNQDKMTTQGRCVGGSRSWCSTGGDHYPNPLLWAGPVSDNCTVVVAINTGASALRGYKLTWSVLGLDPSAKMHARDLWAQTDLGDIAGSINVDIPISHDNKMIKLCPAN